MSTNSCFINLYSWSLSDNIFDLSLDVTGSLSFFFCLLGEGPTLLGLNPTKEELIKPKPDQISGFTISSCLQ
ncbi:hypothetical protein HanIR_Chr09g0393961 [Helianthus annuus]|nr:hypothetical protein HanIR_Chr09g0393961 [Helianthus annuus]